jgi:hypothetical protein
MYRCTSATGVSSFQDRPCAGANAGKRLAASEIADPAALRRWLREQQRSAALTTHNRSAAQRSAPTLAGEALPAHLMGSCSTQFYRCAHADGARMQRCLHEVPLCGASAGSACCPKIALERFRAARAQGASAAQATRSALLGTQSNR